MLAGVVATVVLGLHFGGWAVGQGRVDAGVVEPVDVTQGSQFEVRYFALRSFPVHELRLVQSVHRFGEGVVAVADGADGGIEAGLGEPVGVADRGVLASL